MTLLITECSTAGVVMAADSAIATMDAKGRIVEVNHPGWLKVLKAPKARAAVGYWGIIGKIHHGRFDEWLNKAIEQATYSDLLKLPRFRGHRTIWVRGVHDGQHKSSLPA
jgi:hypothetical protein